MQHIRNSLPESVQIQRVEERFSALGNVIVCNDYVALAHPDIDKVCVCISCHRILATQLSVIIDIYESQGFCHNNRKDQDAAQ